MFFFPTKMLYLKYILKTYENTSVVDPDWIRICIVYYDVLICAETNHNAVLFLNIQKYEELLFS